MRRAGGLFVVAAIVIALSAGAGAARTEQATVGVYASGTSFTATGAAPKHSTSSVSLAMPIDAVDDATILVRGAQHVSLSSPAIDSPLVLKTFFAHYISSKGRISPDVLEPWNGAQRSTEKTNQPIWLQVTVPDGTSPGTYHGSIDVTADGNTTTVPITVTVYNVTLPPQGQVSGALLTAFNTNPQEYAREVDNLYGITADQSLPGFFSFLASYRLSPNTWGYGNPDSKTGYTGGPGTRFVHDRSGNMVAAVGNPRQFASMWIPISNNRSTKSEWAGTLSPFEPQTWCSYLQSVHDFWQNHGWLNGSYPYLYGMDEPGAREFKIVQQQAKVAHQCFPGAHVLITGKPTPQNKFLWNGGSDDVDIFTVLESRYYGEYTTPLQQKRHENRGTMFLRQINAARKRGKQIWTYTYVSRANDTPGFALNEPVADPRMATAWAALEGITGLLRGQGTTSYGPGNPFNVNDRAFGDFVLIYPPVKAGDGPTPSARLEVLREGIEDWEILNVVRQDHGSKAVVKLLSSLFSTTKSGAKLSCVVGCAIKAKQPYSWPLWSKDATTATKLAQMRVAALQKASS
jgi:hypothetical protein